MKVTIITSLLALSTGLTGVLAFPVLTENVNLTVHGGTGLSARDSDNGFLAERAEERKKKHKDPYDCGAPFCGRSTEAITQELESDLKDKRAEERQKKHKDPYDCGAPFCGRSHGAITQELEFDPKGKRGEERKKDPYDCGAPFCGRSHGATVQELEFDPKDKRDAEAEPSFNDNELTTLKRDAEAEPIAEPTPIHHCWQGPEGQVHCDPQKRDAEAEPIHHCWQGPEGQVHCDPQKRELSSKL